MTDDITDQLPCIDKDQPFQFSCGPEQPCFNRCCSELALPLTPYDVLRLCGNLQIPAQQFLQTFASLQRDADTGFPTFQLRMIESPDAPCPFVTPGGCAVYEDRPAACRAYPLGRGAKLDKDGIKERFFMVREEHCCGFDCGRSYTPLQWLEDQGAERHIYFNDRYMRLLSLVKASGQPIHPRFSGLVDVSLWQMDALADLIENTQLLQHVSGPVASNPHLLDKSLSGAEARLEFGLSWLELLIFGEAENLRRNC